MGTTSLKLSDELKGEIQHFAAEEHLTPHAFMVRTLEAEAQRRRARAEFIADAEAAAAEVDAGGPLYAAEDVRSWAKARIRARKTGAAVPEPMPVRGRGAKASAPKAKKAA